MNDIYNKNIQLIAESNKHYFFLHNKMEQSQLLNETYLNCERALIRMNLPHIAMKGLKHIYNSQNKHIYLKCEELITYTEMAMSKLSTQSKK